jgi:hypothetical protein
LPVSPQEFDCAASGHGRGDTGWHVVLAVAANVSCYRVGGEEAICDGPVVFEDTGYFVDGWFLLGVFVRVPGID